MAALVKAGNAKLRSNKLLHLFLLHAYVSRKPTDPGTESRAVLGLLSMSLGIDQ